SLHLKNAVDKGQDVGARSGMLMASLMGAVAFQKGLGIIHSCAYALSTVHDTHHGLANALMLPACLEFNSAVVADRLAWLARIIGLDYKTEVEGAARFVTWI